MICRSWTCGSLRVGARNEPVPATAAQYDSTAVTAARGGSPAVLRYLRRQRLDGVGRLDYLVCTWADRRQPLGSTEYWGFIVRAASFSYRQ